MSLVEALNIAATAGSVLSVCSIFGVLYVWLASQGTAQSAVDAIRAKGIVRPGDVLGILKAFDDENKRLIALETILDVDRELARDVLEKINSDVDVNKYLVGRRSNASRGLYLAAATLIVLTAIAYFEEMRHRPVPPQTMLVQQTKPGLKSADPPSPPIRQPQKPPIHNDSKPNPLPKPVKQSGQANAESNMPFATGNLAIEPFTKRVPAASAAVSAGPNCDYSSTAEIIDILKKKECTEKSKKYLEGSSLLSKWYASCMPLDSSQADKSDETLASELLGQIQADRPRTGCKIP